jgi:hypothetical protein
MPEFAKRYVIWAAETVSTAVLVSLYLMALAGGAPGPAAFVNELLLAFWVIFLIFMLESGYLVTTAVFAMCWRGATLWRYPVIAATLLVLHLQLAPTGWGSRLKVEIQAGGACIIFAVAVAGTWCLRKWR